MVFGVVVPVRSADVLQATRADMAAPVVQVWMRGSGHADAAPASPATLHPPAQAALTPTLLSIELGSNASAALVLAAMRPLTPVARL